MESVLFFHNHCNERVYGWREMGDDNDDRVQMCEK